MSDESEHHPQAHICQVAVPVPTLRAQQTIYDYMVPSTLSVSIGQIVQVPVANRQCWGIVVGTSATSDIEPSRLKQVLRLADAPPLTPQNLHYLNQLSKWTLASFSAAMKLMLNCPQALEPPTPQFGYYLAEDNFEAFQQKLVGAGLKITPKRERLFHAMASLPPMLLSELAAETAVSSSVITSLAKSGVIQKTELTGTSSSSEIALMQLQNAANRLQQELVLSQEQAEIKQQIYHKMQSGFSVHLLEGVPGSGKTETYFSLVAEAIQKNCQILIMLPEIVLTAAWQERFERWFGIAPQIWHSSVSMSKRRKIWRDAICGRPMIVAGARSSLSLPFSNLGLIIVDEEHDSSFKQEDYISYHARDMAIMRAKIHDIPVLLASATPSIESWVRTTDKDISPSKDWYHWVLSSRFGTASLPVVNVIDLRLSRPPKGRWISPELEEKLKSAFEQKTQSLLFLNRRGYAPMTLCNQCGYRLSCHQCDSLLVTHRLAGKRQCHICGHTEKLHDTCPSCAEKGTMQAVGPGVERLVEEAQNLFPEAEICILSSDSIAYAGAAEDMLHRISTGEVDIIIGTQMAAKGHHFPHLGLVGVIDADLGLGGGDLRASERTYQLLWQVAGRSGREGGRQGEVFIQTHQPEHPVMQALITSELASGHHITASTRTESSQNKLSDEEKEAEKRNSFMRAEASGRKLAGMPPFGRLAALTLVSADFVKLEQAVQLFENTRPSYDATQIYGPAPAALSRARGQFRMRYLIRTDRQVALQQILLQWLDKVKLPSGVRAQCDIDPYNFL